MVAGIGYGKSNGFGYLNPTLGMIIREKNDFKTRLSIDYKWNEFNEHTGITTIQLTQSEYFLGHWAVFFSYESTLAKDESEDTFSLKVKRYF
jgi:hypothetical protein